VLGGARAWLVGLGVLALLLVAVLVAGLVWLSRLLDGPELRARVDHEAEARLGRAVGFERLSFDLLPPALVAQRPFVAGETPQAPAFLEAERVSLRPALLPLLERTLVVERLEVEGAVLRLVRTADGVLLPIPPEADAGAGPGGGLAVAVRHVGFEGAKLVFEDRVLDPPVTWHLDDVDLEIEDHGRGAPADVELRMGSDDGTLVVSGTASRDGQLELRGELDRFPLKPLREVLPRSLELAGRASGTLHALGPMAAPERIAADLALSDLAGRAGSFQLLGALALKADLEGELTAPRGHFDVDASQATIHWGGAFTKPAGVAQRARGIYTVEDHDSVRLDGEMQLGGDRHAVRVEVAQRVRIVMDAGSFELSAWRPLLNLLAGMQVSGRVDTERTEILTGPLELRGRTRFQDIRVTLPSGGRVGLEGGLVADGEKVRGQDLLVTGSSGSAPLGLELGDLGRRWAFRVTTRATGLEANDFLTNVSGRRDLLHGPLSLDADLRGRLVGETSLRDALGGRVAFRVAPGRLRGISIFEATFRRHDEGRARGFLHRLKLPGLKVPLASELKRFYGDSFDSLSATLDLGRGLARTDDFLLRTPFYSFAMQGSIRLDDLALDARGQLDLGKDVVASITRDAGIPGVFSGLVLPLPAIGGTLTDPEPQADWTHFWGTLVSNLPGIRLLKKVGQKLPRF
jgi:hypothetical protein